MTDPKDGIAIVSLSGGLDSTSVLLRLLANHNQVFGVSFLYGQKHHVELDKLQDLLLFLKKQGHTVRHTVVDLSSLQDCLHSALTDSNWDLPEGFYAGENMKQTVVPNRNAIFASVAYAFALSAAKQHESHVNFSLGVHSGDHAIYPDCRPEFYQALISAFEIGNWDSDCVSLYLPFLNFDKAQIVSDAIESCRKLNFDYKEVLGRTWTSYHPPTNDGLADGKTGSDVERILAFESLGLKDPVQYAEGWEKAVSFAKSAQNEYEDS